MYHLPGLSHRATAVVIERAEQAFPDWDKPVGRPKTLSLLQALKLTVGGLQRSAHRPPWGGTLSRSSHRAVGAGQ